MAKVEQIKCDTCGTHIVGNNYIKMSFEDMRTDHGASEDEICLRCYDRIRSYLRRGCPMVSLLDEFKKTDLIGKEIDLTTNKIDRNKITC